MKEVLLEDVAVNVVEADATASYSKTHTPREVFFCPEESQFYSQCLEKMVFNRCTTAVAIEFGAGDGSPVIRLSRQGGDKFF